MLTDIDKEFDTPIEDENGNLIETIEDGDVFVEEETGLEEREDSFYEAQSIQEAEEESIDTTTEFTANAQENYSIARQQLTEIYTKILEAGEIRVEDHVEIAQLKEKYSQAYNTIKENTENTQKKSLDERVTQLEGATLATSQEILDALTQGGRKPWLYTDESGNVLMDSTSIPELTLLSRKLSLIATDGEDESSIVLTPTMIQMIAESDIQLSAKKILINGLLEGKGWRVTEEGNLDIQELNAVKAQIGTLDANEVIADKLHANTADIESLRTNKADITDLNATNGNITNLTSQVGNIQTLVNGHLTSDNIQSLILSSDKVTVANAFIKDAMIDTISANKLTTGQLNTNKVNIASNDGSLLLNGSLQQFKDKNGKVRIQMGKDAQGNFTFGLFDETGNGTLIDSTGVKAKAIGSGLIVDNMVSDNANIDGSKLDINSVVNSINNGTNTIKGTKVKLDKENQSLELAFNNMQTTVSSHNSSISSHTTQLTAQAGQINTLISDTTISEDGQNKKLKDAYSSLKQTVGGISSKVGEVESNFDNLQINTRNLLQNTDFKTLPPTYEVMHGITYKLTSDERLQISTTDDYIDGNCIKFKLTKDIQPNETLTISFKGNSWSTSNTKVRFKMSYGVWTNWETIGIAGVNTFYSKTFNVGEITPNSWLWIEFSYGCYILPKTLKITNSDKLSDWTLAPEDVDEKFTNYSTTSQMNSAIEQKADEITHTVSNTYYNKSNIDGKVSTINSSISTAQQKANMFDWLVKSGSSSSNLTLTDSTITAIAKSNIKLKATQITLEGLVTANSNFKILTDGSIEAKNGKFTGSITGSTFSSANDIFQVLEDGSIQTDFLAVGDELSTDSLTVNTINSRKYPATLDSNVTVTVNSSIGNDDSEFTDGSVFQTLQGAINACPKNLGGCTVNITLMTNTTENIYYEYYYSGRMRIFFNGKTLYGYLRAYMNKCVNQIYGGTIDNQQGQIGKIMPNKGYGHAGISASVSLAGNSDMAMYKMDIYKATNLADGCTEDAALCCGDGGYIYVSDVTPINSTNGFRTNANALIYSNASGGKASKYGFSAVSGGQIRLSNGKHTGGNPDTYESSGGTVKYHNATFNTTAEGGDNTSNPTPVTQKVTYTSNSGDTYRSTVYNSWKKDNTVRQGNYGYGNSQGCWFFGGAFSNLQGNTIEKVTIKIKRQSGGNSSAVTHTLVAHNYSSRPGGAPSFISGFSQDFTLAVNATATITITNSTVLNAIKSGTLKGFGLKGAYDKTHYGVCSGSATVVIYYH